MWHWLLHITGVDGNAHWLNFWSGFGSDIGEVAILGAVVGAYRKHACHAKGCWRISRHPVEGTPYIVCRKHHPTIDQEPTAEDIHAAHLDAKERRTL